jgi:hypothetical protein
MAIENFPVLGLELPQGGLELRRLFPGGQALPEGVRRGQVRVLQRQGDAPLPEPVHGGVPGHRPQPRAHLPVPDFPGVLPQGQEHVGGDFFLVLRAQAPPAAVVDHRDHIAAVFPHGLLQRPLAAPQQPLQQFSFVHRVSSVLIS